jgi:geranylgeranyl reductase family protein
MDADVAIIGGGPGGALAACLLARGGARVLIFDPSHPREKPCGGGITGRALALISDVLDRGAVPAVRIRTARFVETDLDGQATRNRPSRVNGGPAVVSLADDALVVASRRTFDGELFQAACRAGADHVTARVRHLSRHDARFRIETTEGRQYSVSRLIGADGANSLTRRTLGSAFRRDQLSMATGFFAHGVTSDEVVIELLANPPGYLWSFPRPTHLAIGICAQADAGVDVGTLRSLCRTWIDRLELARGGALEPYSWPIPSLSSADFQSLEPAGPGWYLVGDAAGLVDPITREGIFFALQSARYAADAILADADRAGAHYVGMVRREIADDLARGARLKAAFFRPGFAPLLVSSLTQSERIRAVMADLVAGTQSYRTLKWRLARTMEVRVAWRLLRSMG